MIYPNVITVWLKSTEGRQATWERIVYRTCRFEPTYGAYAGTGGDTSARAADLLVKPFGMLELSCRIRAVLRRCEAQKCVDYRNIKMNITDHSVLINGEKIKLTPTEFSLLFELVMAGGKVVSKKSLIRNVWGAESSASDHTLKESIRRLRKKIGKDAIDSVYGEGFIFVPEQ